MTFIIETMPLSIPVLALVGGGSLAFTCHALVWVVASIFFPE